MLPKMSSHPPCLPLPRKRETAITLSPPKMPVALNTSRQGVGERQGQFIQTASKSLQCLLILLNKVLIRNQTSIHTYRQTAFGDVFEVLYSQAPSTTLALLLPFKANFPCCSPRLASCLLVHYAGWHPHHKVSTPFPLSNSLIRAQR